MRIILLILSLIVFSNSNSQSKFEKYDALLHKAMIEFKDKEYQKSLNNFEMAFKILPDGNVSDYFYAAAAALNLKDPEKAKDLIIASIHNTHASKNYFLSFREFNSFRNETLFSEIEKEYGNHISKFYKNLKHPDIYREVDSLMERDQEMRTNGSKWKEISRIDSLNINRLIEITKKYGWQNKGWLILWHQRGTYGEENYVWNFFKPYIDSQIKKGEMRKDFWTLFEEEKSLINNKEQILGLYTNQFKEYPIKDIKNVDRRRAEFGLPPLWYMEKIYGIELPKEYKKL